MKTPAEVLRLALLVLKVHAFYPKQEIYQSSKLDFGQKGAAQVMY